MKVFLVARWLSVVFLLLLSLGFSQEVYSVGAFPYSQKIEQADGSVLTIRLHGDEWFNWTSTIDGYRIKKNRSGFYEYASVLKSGQAHSSGMRANNPEARSEAEKEFLRFMEKGPGVSNDFIQKKLKSRSSEMLKSSSGVNTFAATGLQKMLVILANFSDTSPIHSQPSFDNLMNQVDYNGTGSFRDYYLENSGGQLDMISVVTQWVTVPNSKAYYAPDSLWGTFALHAIEAAAAAGVDFSEFDNSGNGIVEGVAIIHQGPGKEVTGSEEDIWSHSWTLSAAGYAPSVRTFNGVVVNQYTLQPETRNAAGSLNTMGVIAHEFGHNLGLPDYYDTETEDEITYDGTGNWDMMAKGTYNGNPNGSSPAHHNPLSKYELGWVDMVDLTMAGSIEVLPVHEDRTVYKISSPVEHEYLLLENRRKQGFDAFLPGEGLIVYHADDEQISAYRSSNTINTREHQGLFIMAAGGDINTASAPFPGSLNITQLTDETDPAMVTWTGQVFNRSITGISNQGNSVHFDYMAVQNGSPLSLEVTTITSDALTLVWEASLGGEPVLLAFSETGFFGTPETGQVYSPGDAITGGGTVLYYGDSESSLLHSDLQSSKRYYYSIWSYLEGEWSASLLTSALTNPLPVTTFPWYEGFESGLDNWRQTFDNGTYEWRAVANGDKNQPDTPYEGASFAYFHAPDYDQRVTTLVSPVLDLLAEETYLLDFRHFQAAWDGDQDWLKVLVKTVGGSDWVEVAYFSEEADEWMQRRVEIPFSEPLQIAFQGISNYGYGIGVDDVKVYAGSQCNATLSQVSDVVQNSYTETTMNVSWSIPVATNVLVVMRENGAVTDLPTPGETYTANSEFGLGYQFPDTSFVVYNGSGADIEISGLHHSSEYHLAFFTYTDVNCYGTEAVRAKYSTVQVFYPLNVIVTSNGQPMKGVQVSLDGSRKITDMDGLAAWSVGHSSTYMALSVDSAGYISHWQRYLPDSEQIVNVELIPTDLVVPRNLRHTVSYKTVTLNWDPVINANFDGYKPFVLNLAGWVMEDKDEYPTYSLKGLSFPNENYTGSFIVLDPYYSGLLQADFDMTAYSGRHVLAAFASSKGANDDWLISPELEISEGDAFSFMARSISDTYGLESIRVLVADQSAGTGEFELISLDTEQVPVAWTAFSYDLSAYVGKRVKLAIQYISNDTHALLLDQITVGAVTGSNSELAPLSKMLSAESKRASPTNKVVTADKKAVHVAMSVSASEKGRIGYGIQLNGESVAEVSGFSTTVFSMNVSGCLGNEFKIQSKDVVYSGGSDWSAPNLVNACNTVTLVVYNNNNQPIQGAWVKFDTLEAYTDANGEVLFIGIENVNEANFEVSANGFMPESGQLIVNGDIDTLVFLNPVITDSTSVRNEDISIFPNPVLDNLSVLGIYGEIDIRVFDLSGRIVKHMQIEAYHTFDLPLGDLQSGIYLVKFAVGGKTFMRKVVKQ